MDIFRKLAEMRFRISDLESLNEQKDSVIARLNDECEIHAGNNVKLRDEIKDVQKAHEKTRELNRKKNGILTRVYREKKDLEIQLEDMESSRDFARENAFRFRNAMNGYADDLNAQMWQNRKNIEQSNRRARIIELLRNRIRRLEIQLRIRQDVANEWEEIAQHYKRERNEYQGIARSYGRTISEQDRIIESLRDELAALKNAGPETEPEMTEVICGPEIIIDFNARPDIIGYAPCGNGCPVKRGIDGRMYDDHEITCEDSPEYSGIDL